jgi:hypothetical protein
MLSLRNCVQSPGEGAAAAELELEASSEVCASAGVLVVASISHSGAIVNIQLTILKEAVCFLLTRQIGDFMAKSPENSGISRERGRRAGMEALGSGLVGR